MTQDERCSVLIADDHPVFRRGLRDIIEHDKSLLLVAEAEDSLAALERIAALRPRVAVLDLNMPLMTGLDVAREVFHQRLPVGIVFLTLYDDEVFFDKAMDTGAAGYLLKDSAAADIVHCIHAVAAGELFISPAMSGRALKRHGPFAPSDGAALGIARLSPAERRVLRLLAEYKNSEAIALELFISPKTVDNHRANISRKLDLAGRNALLRFALEHRHQL